MAYATRFRVNSRNTFLISVQFLICSLCFTNAQLALDDAGCITPHGKVGNCVEIRDCVPMTTILRESAKIITEVAPLLSNYRCGVIDEKIKVCCPSVPITLSDLGIDTRAADTSTIESTFPDVSQHKNLHLLPIDDCGPLPTGERLAGGKRTVLFEFPWMALLSYKLVNGGMEFSCAGTIINSRYILTAAHCLTNLYGNILVGVRCGEYNISSANDCERATFFEEVCAPPVQDMQIEKIIVHEKYSVILQINDIGLIRLAAPLNMTVESVKPICLPLGESNRNYNYTNNGNLIVSGWGRTENGTTSEDLLKFSVPVVSNYECESKMKQVLRGLSITSKHICAGGVLGKDTCNGDSGGPLQAIGEYNYGYRFIQHGIISFGIDCGRTGIPGVYTRVQAYMDWILDNLEP